MRHEIKRITRTLYRCACGSEFTNEDDADLHAANARQEERERAPDGETVDKITEYGLTQRLSRPVRVF